MYGAFHRTPPERGAKMRAVIGPRSKSPWELEVGSEELGVNVYARRYF
jgi:hypothetical protein